MLRTRFTDMVGCSVPIQLAPMGAAGMEPAAAVVRELAEGAERLLAAWCE